MCKHDTATGATLVPGGGMSQHRGDRCRQSQARDRAAHPRWESVAEELREHRGGPRRFDPLARAPHGEPRRRGARGHRRISGGRGRGAPRRRPSRARAPSQRRCGLRPESTSARENGSHRCRADCRLRPHAAASALGAAAARSAPIAGAGPAARCAARDADPGNESARARRPDRAAVDRGDARTSARRDRRHQAADRRITSISFRRSARSAT